MLTLNHKPILHHKPSQGFTLIEVIVALAVIALGMGAAMTSVTANISNAAALKERTLAHWVASNKIAEMQATKVYPRGRRSNESVEMAGVEWHVQVLKTDMKLSGLKDFGIDTSKYKQLEVQVRLSEDAEYPIVSLTSYIVE